MFICFENEYSIHEYVKRQRRNALKSMISCEHVNTIRHCRADHFRINWHAKTIIGTEACMHDEQCHLFYCFFYFFFLLLFLSTFVSLLWIQRFDHYTPVVKSSGNCVISKIHNCLLFCPVITHRDQS